jgi:hypothetical protein
MSDLGPRLHDKILSVTDNFKMCSLSTLAAECATLATLSARASHAARVACSRVTEAEGLIVQASQTLQGVLSPPLPYWISRVLGDLGIVGLACRIYDSGLKYLSKTLVAIHTQTTRVWDGTRQGSKQKLEIMRQLKQEWESIVPVLTASLAECESFYTSAFFCSDAALKNKLSFSVSPPTTSSPFTLMASPTPFRQPSDPSRPGANNAFAQHTSSLAQPRRSWSPPRAAPAIYPNHVNLVPDSPLQSIVTDLSLLPSVLSRTPYPTLSHPLTLAPLHLLVDRTSARRLAA